MIRYTQTEIGAGDEQRVIGPFHALVQFGAQFDLISPTVALLGQLSGGLVQLATPLDRWGETRALLRGGGVRIITTQSSPRLGVMMFTVGAKHAQRAAQLLR